MALSNFFLHSSAVLLFTVSAGSLFHVFAVLYEKRLPHKLALAHIADSSHPLCEM